MNQLTINYESTTTPVIYNLNKNVLKSAELNYQLK